VGNLGDILQQRHGQLGMDRQDALALVQEELERRYPGRARALGLQHGKLRITTPSSSVAGDLHMRQMEFLDSIRPKLAGLADVSQIVIQIR
jgi:hypothetical protein